jgi:5-methyltetrahydrofolate--homocysteine methyltransferase
VNGEAAKLRQVLPVVKDYGAAVIGLTMDDRGIPKEAFRRLEIAERILEAAVKQGIPQEDVVIDPLAMAVSTDDRAAVETLKAMQLIRDKLGLNLTLGVSNISFGLPDRHAFNVVFLSMAIVNGLNCPIIDPTVWEIRKAIMIADVLTGNDEFCINYITVYREKFPDA